jgi:hypothetical protein
VVLAIITVRFMAGYCAMTAVKTRDSTGFGNGLKRTTPNYANPTVYRRMLHAGRVSVPEFGLDGVLKDGQQGKG